MGCALFAATGDLNNRFQKHLLMEQYMYVGIADTPSLFVVAYSLVHYFCVSSNLCVGFGFRYQAVVCTATVVLTIYLFATRCRLKW